MRHLRETDLVRLVAAELDPGPQQAAEAHLAECAACRAALQEHRALHDLLGAWEPEAAGDAWPAIERALNTPAPLRLRAAALQQFGRAAALVAVSVGLGFGSGRIAGWSAPAPPQAAASASPEEALGALGFHVIESPSATGLFTAMTAPAHAGGTGEEP